VIAVPVVERGRVGLAMLLAYLAFCALYLGAHAVRLVPPTTLAPGVLDRALPFLDWSIWIYVSQFALLAGAIVLARDDADRSRVVYGALMATALAAAVFVAYPTQVVRVQPPGEGLTGLAWRALHLADVPGNCFPSLHVALATIAGWALWRRGARALAVGWVAAIAVSTVTTRQHVALDAIAGFPLAALALYLTPRMLRLERTQPAHDAANA